MARKAARGQHPDGGSRPSTTIRRRDVLGLCIAAGIGTLSEHTMSETTNTLTVTETEGTLSTYEVTVSEQIQPTETPEAPGGASTEDAIRDGVHRYLFTGKLTDFRARGDANVYVNGERVDATL
jgi:hypothetical protein